MQSSILLTTSADDGGPALMRRSTVPLPGENSVVASALVHAYGATLLTAAEGVEPVPSNVCQLKLPLAVVWKLRP